MRTVIFIPTCRRPDMLLRLLTDLSGQPARVIVFQDGVFSGYENIREIVRVYDKPHGRELYWRLINDALQYLRKIDFDRVIFLADDMRVGAKFVETALTEFDRCGGTALNLLNDGRAGLDQWGINYRGYANGFHHTNWLDMCFVSGRLALDLLRWEIKPIYRNWLPGRLLGSGVGKQISKRIISQGGTIFQVEKSLVLHGGHLSEMNPERKTALKNVADKF